MNKTLITLDRLTTILSRKLPVLDSPYIKIYGVPRGGVCIASICATVYTSRGNFPVFVNSPGSADIIVDDIIDSGATRERVLSLAKPGTPFVAAIDKTDPECEYRNSGWIVFPWENKDDEKDIGEYIDRVRQYFGRFLGAWKVLTE